MEVALEMTSVPGAEPRSEVYFCINDKGVSHRPTVAGQRQKGNYLRKLNLLYF